MIEKSRTGPRRGGVLSLPAGRVKSKHTMTTRRRPRPHCSLIKRALALSLGLVPGWPWPDRQQAGPASAGSVRPLAGKIDAYYPNGSEHSDDENSRRRVAALPQPCRRPLPVASRLICMVACKCLLGGRVAGWLGAVEHVRAKHGHQSGGATLQCVRPPMLRRNREAPRAATLNKFGAVSLLLGPPLSSRSAIPPKRGTPHCTRPARKAPPISSGATHAQRALPAVWVGPPAPPIATPINQAWADACAY